MAVVATDSIVSGFHVVHFISCHSARRTAVFIITCVIISRMIGRNNEIRWATEFTDEYMNKSEDEDEVHRDIKRIWTFRDSVHHVQPNRGL